MSRVTLAVLLLAAVALDAADAASPVSSKRIGPPRRARKLGSDGFRPDDGGNTGDLAITFTDDTGANLSPGTEISTDAGSAALHLRAAIQGFPSTPHGRDVNIVTTDTAGWTWTAGVDPVADTVVGVALFDFHRGSHHFHAFYSMTAADIQAGGIDATGGVPPEFETTGLTLDSEHPPRGGLRVGAAFVFDEGDSAVGGGFGLTCYHDDAVVPAGELLELARDAFPHPQAVTCDTARELDAAHVRFLKGACCTSMECEDTSAVGCAADGGHYHGDHTRCVDVRESCTPGACCMDGRCYEGLAADCDGSFLGAGSSCGRAGLECIESCPVQPVDDIIFDATNNRYLSTECRAHAEMGLVCDESRQPEVDFDGTGYYVVPGPDHTGLAPCDEVLP